MNKTLARLATIALAIAIALPVVFSFDGSASAQGTNLIQNGAMNGPFLGLTNGKGQIPPNWQAWANGEAPINDYHQFAAEVRSAPSSWVQRCSFLTCTGGGYQQVNGLTPDTTYRFTIYGFIWTCKNEDNTACRNSEGRYVNEDSNARVRVGIDPTGGTDANASTVLWGSFATPWLAYQAVSADFIATGGSATVFTYWTQAVAMEFNEVFWDDASLVALGEGEGAPLNSGATSGTTDGDGSDTSAPPPQTVPFVSPQSARPDGSVVHIVGEGDTVASIVVAYRDLTTRDEIYALNDWELPPAIISIGQEIKILPPGSVDPSTGRLLSAPRQQATQAPTPPPPPQGSATQSSATPVPSPPPPPPSDAGDDDGEIQGGVGPSTPRIDPDVKKGGSLLPGASSHFFTFSRRPVRRMHMSLGDGTGRVCVKFFADTDQDLLHTNSEAIISGGQFTLAKQDYAVDGVTCVDDVTPGRVTVTATAPSGYGFVSSPEFEVRVFPNREVLVAFSILEGFSIPDSAPPVEEPAVQRFDPVPVEESTTEEDGLAAYVNDYASFIFFGVAALVGILSGVVVWTYRR